MGKIADDNDLLKIGKLPLDPEADASPMTLPKNEGSKGMEELEAEKLPRTVGQVFNETMPRIMRRATLLEKPLSLPWESVNRTLNGGLWPGMYVIVGNTGAGKSQWALQVTLHTARQNIPTLYVGLELGEIDITARLLGLLSGQRWSHIAHGCDSVMISDAIATHQKEMEELPIHVEFAPPYGWNYNRLKRKAQLMRDAYPLDKDQNNEPIRGSRPFLIVLDYLQVVAAPPNQSEDLRTRIQKTAYAARAIARDLDAVLLLLSSTARENYAALGGLDKTKKKADLGEGNPTRFVGLGKESGEIEYGADGVFVLAREPWQNNEPPLGGTLTHLIIAKNRSGAPNWCRLRFNVDRFEDENNMEVNL